MFRTSRVASPRRPYHMAVELLEDRATPASFQWGLDGTTHNWTDSTNWQVPAMGGGWAQAPAGNTAGINYPGASDDVYFNNTSSKIVAVNVAALGNVNVAANYGGTLSFTIGPYSAAKLLMDGGTMQASAEVTLVLKGAGSIVKGGTFDKVDLQVGVQDAYPTPPTATLRIDGDITLKNNFIYVAGGQAGNELNWFGGSITTSGTAYIMNYGVTLISSSGTLGNMADTTKKVLSNGNSLQVNSTPTIAGNFVNASSFVVRQNANVKINGTATQTAGTTELRGGTITMTTSTGVYAVDAGSLIGDGTIDGNLTLGTTSNGAVSISPGYSGADIGTLTITKSMHMISTSASTSMQVFANGTFDKIVVQNGYAILNGTLTVNIATGYKPALGTKHTFITAPTFKAPGTTTATDFSTRALTGQTGIWFVNPGGMRVWRWSPAVDGSYSVHVGDSMS